MPPGCCFRLLPVPVMRGSENLGGNGMHWPAAQVREDPQSSMAFLGFLFLSSEAK